MNAFLDFKIDRICREDSRTGCSQNIQESNSERPIEVIDLVLDCASSNLINFRFSDYLAEVRKWYGILMPKMEKYLYGNGGPIIMVQVENEYGSYSACDRQYSIWLKNETERYVGDKAVLFTNDGPAQLPCGKIDGVLATLDFGAGNQRWVCCAQ